jgi:hypothetical protein
MVNDDAVVNFYELGMVIVLSTDARGLHGANACDHAAAHGRAYGALLSIPIPAKPSSVVS